MDKSLNIKYILSSIFYYGAMSSMMGFASVFLISKGFMNSHIGIVLAASNIIAAILQPAVAVLVDKSSSSKTNLILRILIGVIVILSLSLYVIPLSEILLVVLFSLVLALTITLMPFINSLAFMFEKYGYKVNFGLARGLGSVSYAVTSMILGNIVAHLNPSIIPLSYLIFSVLLYIVIKSYTVKEAKDEIVEEKVKQKDEVSLLEFFSKYKIFMIFLIGVVGAFFTHMLINNFFIQVINNIGGDSGDMGNAIFVAAMVELPIMMFFEKINSKFKSSTIIKVSMFFFVLKHLLTYLAKNMLVLYVAQFLQIFAYALFIPASVYYVNEIVSENDRVKGQSLVTTASVVAGVFASLAGGVLLDNIGVKETLLIGVITTIIGFAISLFTVSNKKSN